MACLGRCRAFIVHPVDQHTTRLLIRSRGSSWLLAAGVLVAASVRVLVQREQWWRPYLVAAGAMGVLPGLLFWQPPVALGVLADGALLGALVGSRRPRPRPNPGRRAWAGRLAATS